MSDRERLEMDYGKGVTSVTDLHTQANDGNFYLSAHDALFRFLYFVVSHSSGEEEKKNGTCATLKLLKLESLGVEEGDEEMM